MFGWPFVRRRKLLVQVTQAAKETANEEQHCQRYEINVAHKGHHLFATERWLRKYSAEHVASLVRLFGQVFPRSEGYSISVASFLCTTKNPAVIEQALSELEAD